MHFFESIAYTRDVRVIKARLTDFNRPPKLLGLNDIKSENVNKTWEHGNHKRAKLKEI